MSYSDKSSKQLSRRQFLKGATAGALGVAAVGLMGACANTAAPAEPTAAAPTTAVSAEAKPLELFIPGTYTSTQSTGFATVLVSCTYSSSALTKVTYDVTETSSSDYFPNFTSQMQEYCDKIVAAGSPVNVDSVSGASLCSKAIKDGVNACTAQALGVTLAPASPAAAQLNPQDYNYTSNSITDFADTKLFSEWKLGPLTLHHRMVKSAAFQLAFFMQNPDEYISYYENFAKGGVEMIWVENYAALVPMVPGGPFKTDITAYDTKRLVDMIHSYGAYAGYQFDTMGSPIGPLTYTEPFIGNLTTDEIHELQSQIVAAAKTLKDYGFDAFEINSAANNVGQSFLSRVRNNRTDEYGPQSFESRTLFVRELIAGIKEACGKDFVVQVLINGIEENDINLGDSEQFNSIEDTIEIAKLIESAGADSLHVRLGPPGQHIAQFSSDLYFTARGMEGTTGFGETFDFSRHWGGKAIANHSGCGMMLDIAAEIKKAVNIPVGTVTYMDPAHAPDFFEQALVDEKVDFLIINRPFCVDPEYVNKLREGRIDEIAPCTRCLHCFYDPDKDGMLMEHCRVNACIRRAYNAQMPEGYTPKPADGPKNIMVIGGGPAGMEAARIAAERGYSVTLYEKNSTLGGMLPFAHAVKGPHENLDRFNSYLQRQLELKGVNVVLEKSVDAAFIQAEKPDAVILAVGGQRPQLTLSATASTNVISVDDVLGGNVGDNITVLGSNCQAVDTAIYLLSLGKKVTIVTPDPMASFEKGHSVNVRGFIEPAIYASGTRVWTNASVKSVGDGEITIQNDVGVDRVIKCDTIVDASDMLPNTSIIDGLGIPAVAAGDCKLPLNIAGAIADGNLAARNI